MREHQVSRTLVKSPPELWAECSDPSSLARHLNESFGEIRITRLQPETAVAWEGEEMSGTVKLEPSGWGTKVILTAVAPGAVDDDEDDPPPQEPEPRPAPSPLPPAASMPRGLMGRLRAMLGTKGVPAPAVAEPIVAVEPPPAEEPGPANPAELALSHALDSLGQAHHRPYSRS